MSRRTRLKPLDLDDEVAKSGLRLRPRWRRRLVVTSLLLVALVALAPTIICVTPLWRVVAGRLVPAEAGKLDIAKLSLGWVTPIDIHGLTLSEPTGEKVLEIERLQISRSLVDLMLASRSLGTIRVDRPRLHVAVRSDGSNVEDLAARLAKALEEKFPRDDPDTERPTRFRLELIDGVVETTDVATGNKWLVSGVNITLDRSAAEVAVIECTASGHIGPPTVAGAATVPLGPEQPGSFQVALEPVDDHRQQVRLRTAALPLAAIEPWCRRFDAALQVAGSLTGEGSATWTPPTIGKPADDQPQPNLVQQIRAAQWSTSGRFVADDVSVSAAALAGDRVTLTSVELPWRLASHDGSLIIDELQIRTPIGLVFAQGTISREELQTFAATDFLQLKNFELQSSMDLAGVATMLPQLLQVRADTAITSGRAALTLRSQLEGQTHVLTGDLQAADLVATRGGAAVRWNQPIHASFVLRDPAERFELESLRCDSEFLQLDSSGNAGGLRGKLGFDLGRLFQQLGEFIDLDAWTLAGTGAADFNWGSTAPGQFTATLNGDLTKVQVAHAGRDILREPSLRLEGTAIGDCTAESPWPTRLASGEFTLRTDSDQLQASLVAPVDLTVANWSCPINASLSGNVANWLLRMQPWIDSSQWTVEGTIAAQLGADVGPVGVRVSQSEVKLTNLRASSPEWLIVEPRIELLGSGSCDRSSGLIEVPDAQFVSSTISGRVAELRWPTGASTAAAAAGNVALRADLARLSAWRTKAQNPGSWSLAGRVIGSARIQRDGSRVVADLDLTGDNLQLQDLAPAAGAPPRVVWQEPKITVAGHAAYDPTTDRLGLENLQVTSNMLRLATTGAVEEFSTIGRAQLVSSVDYDLAQITPLLAPFVGRGVALTGRHQGRLELRGQLSDPSLATSRHWSQRWQGRFDLPWTGATLYGLNVGPGKLVGVLIEGVATFTPIDAPVGEGRLQASPLLRLDPPPALATLAPGQVITNVRITPEVSDTLLKYIAPALADATRSEGLFSLKLDQTSVPLGDAARADIAGELHIHSAQVQPGPMVTQWTQIAREVESLAKSGDPSGLLNRSPTTLVSITDRRVKFRLVDGRVHSEGFAFEVGDVIVRSRGSVGLDETLELMLNLPLQDRWLEGRPLLVGLRGQSLQIPVVGTFKRPQIDRSALAGLTRQMLQGAAQQAVGNEINRALEGLFKPRQSTSPP
ncbi:MAG: hypothetical protein WD851_04760 [Pirellulales bacterium]